MNLKLTITKNLPTILSATSIVGLGGTCVLVAKETPNAQKQPTFWKRVWAYKGAITAGIATTACIISADRINVKRLAQAAIDYNNLVGRFSEYKAAAEKVLENAGVGAGAVAAEIAATKDIPEKPDVELDEDGEVLRLVWDNYLHEFYYCSMAKLYLADLMLQEEFDVTGYARANVFYAETGVKINGDYVAEMIDDNLGWDMEYLLDENEVQFVPMILDAEYKDPKTGESYVFLDFPLEPRFY